MLQNVEADVRRMRWDSGGGGIDPAAGDDGGWGGVGGA